MLYHYRMTLKCIRNLEKWAEDEDKRLKKKTDDTDFFETALNLAAGVTNNLIEGTYNDFNMLNAIKKDVFRSVSELPDIAPATSLSRQNQNLDKLKDLLEDLEEKVNLLNEISAIMPDPKEKESLQKIKDSLRIIVRNSDRDTEPYNNSIQGLVDRDIIDQETADAYLQDNISPQLTGQIRTIQVVNEVRDRYYTISNQDFKQVYENYDPNSIVKLVDQNGESIADIAGHTPANTTPNSSSTITLRPDSSDGLTQNQSITLNIQPTNSTGGVKPTAKRSSLNNERQRAVQYANNLKEEMGFEIWACLLFDIYDYIDGIFVAFDAIAADFGEVGGIIESISKSIGQNIDIPLSSFPGIARIDSFINEIQQFSGATLSEILSFEPSITLRNANQGSRASAALSVCDANKERYCGAVGELRRLGDNISFELDGLSWDIEGKGFSIDTPKFLELRKVSLEIANGLKAASRIVPKLKEELCYIVENKIRARPRSNRALLDAISAISILLIAFPPLDPAYYGLRTADTLLPFALRLQKIGYSAGADKLLKGDVLGFLSTEEPEMTSAGLASACLKDAAESTDNPVEADKLYTMSKFAESRSQQAVTGQRVREGMHSRFNRRDNKAAAVRDKAVPILRNI